MPKVENIGEITAQFLDRNLYPAEVLLVVSPITGIKLPVLGLHLLQAANREAGISTGILYGNFPYAGLIGEETHGILAGDYRLLLGERLFATSAFGDKSLSLEGKQKLFSAPAWAPDHLWPLCPLCPKPAPGKTATYPPPVDSYKKWLARLDLEQLETLSTRWLHELAGRIAVSGSRIVGCSTTLGGLVPAIAVLNCIKKANPDIITILGGALCEAEMADGIRTLNTGIDYIFSGEGEITFPILVKRILSGNKPTEPVIRGQEVSDPDSIPIPDYHDYVRQKKMFSAQSKRGGGDLVLPFETSRGCWYGKCHFCGLNGKTNSFRAKSPDRVIQSLDILAKQHRFHRVAMADNMMPNRFFETLLPRLPHELPNLTFFYQMKASLGLPQVMALEKAGIHGIQVGIEALSASLLRRMNKPYTLRGNIAVLRYARAVGLPVEWTLLFGIPGDRAEEYRETLHLLPLIRHLQPPMDLVPLVLYRYSQYHRAPEEFAISGIHPAGVFNEILPPHADLEKIAFYFSGTYPAQSHENPELITALWQEFQAWQEAWAAYRVIPMETLLPGLHVTQLDDCRWVLEDTRGIPGQPERREIDGEQASLLLVARPLQSVPRELLQWALEAGLGIAAESWFIPLATAAPAILLELEKENHRPGTGDNLNTPGEHEAHPYTPTGIHRDPKTTSRDENRGSPIDA